MKKETITDKNINNNEIKMDINQNNSHLIEKLKTKGLIKFFNNCYKIGEIFVVGGAVRNILLGLDFVDIDLCGSLTTDQVEKICDKLKFTTKVVNKNLGTIQIIVSDLERYEYTTFRVDNYNSDGSHTPEQVSFVDDISVDAKRRDFTCNAIYYNILDDRIIDFYNGIKDIKNKKIKCIESASYVFESDGLRVLRMIRFASQLGFKIEKNTYKQAKLNSYKLSKISKERRLTELKQIVKCDLKYGSKDKSFVKYLNECNVFKYMFNNINMKIRIKTSGFFYNKFFTAQANSRYYAFAMLMLLNKYKFQLTTEAQLNLDINNMLGFAGLGDSNTNLEMISTSYKVMQELLTGKKLCLKNVCNYYNLDAIQKSIVTIMVDDKYVTKIIDKYKQQGYPLNDFEINLDNNILSQKVNNKNITNIRKILLKLCLEDKIKNDPEVLLEKSIQLDEMLNTKHFQGDVYF